MTISPGRQVVPVGPPVDRPPCRWTSVTKPRVSGNGMSSGTHELPPRGARLLEPVRHVRLARVVRGQREAARCRSGRSGSAGSGCRRRCSPRASSSRSGEGLGRSGWRAMNRAVAGSTCISPTAPRSERESGTKPLSRVDDRGHQRRVEVVAGRLRRGSRPRTPAGTTGARTSRASSGAPVPAAPSAASTTSASSSRHPAPPAAGPARRPAGGAACSRARRTAHHRAGQRTPRTGRRPRPRRSSRSTRR